MPTKKITLKKNTPVRKTLLKTIKDQLHRLPSLKKQLGEKKLEKRIKKAAKLLIDGIKQIPTRKTGNTVKKTATTRKKRHNSKNYPANWK